MTDRWQAFAGNLDRFAGKWPGYAALGTFLIYLFGYLALRFQLYAYGVSVSLDAFDEKYFFAGCRFLVFLVTTISTLVLVLAIFLFLLYVGYRLIPAAPRDRLQARFASWRKRPYLLRVYACLLPLLLVQFALRHCFFLSDMLLRARPPEDWITSVLLSGDSTQAFYFAGLVLGTALSAGILAAAVKAPAPAGGLAGLFTGLAGFLAAVAFLLLPVNYGILVGSGSLPRVSQVEDQSKLASGAAAWLVWESKETLTYLVCENQSRTLISIPRKETRVAIIANDAIFQAVAQPPCAAAREVHP